MKKLLAIVMTVLLMATASLQFSSALAAENAAPSVIPAIREWKGSSGKFVPNAQTVLVNASGVDAVEKVKTFFLEMTSLDLSVKKTSSGSNEIVFKLDTSLSKSLGDEGYKLTATKNGIEIKAATNIGLLYGGVSVVQSVSADGFFPCGNATDYPAYPLRSGMLDVGRAWIPMDYVHEITRYMAYYKMNEIHLHINDDGSNGYSGFRLESNVKGLSSKDGYYTKDEYRAYQKEMLEYGITVVTEIDTPFHSSCYANAENPPPYLPGNNRCLDISKPETIKFVKDLFAEYMTGDDPVFVGKVVHIGTDEYPREYAEQMRWYTNELIEYVNSLGYTPRFWGGLGPNGFQGKTPISEKAQMNYWDNGISGFAETKASKYDIINTVNAILYTVPTTNYSFPDYFDLKNLYVNWQVNKFAIYDDTKVWDANDKRLLGASFALWNDLHTSYKGVTRFDIFDRLRGMVCLVAEKTWCGLDTAKMSYDNFQARFDKLSLRAGDADPGRHSLEEEISVDFESALPSFVKTNGGKVKDGKFVLDGKSYLTLTPNAVGFPNTLEFEIRLDEATNAPIFAGDGVQILANADGKGNFGFKTEVYTFTYNYQLPIGKTVKIRLTSDLTTTYLTVNDSLSFAPYNQKNPNDTKLTTLTIPLKEIGKGVKGTIDNIKVSPKSVDLTSLLANRNLALNAKTTVSGLEVYDGRLNEKMAVDGDEGTRLSFARDKDEQWLLVDLGKVNSISRIEISFFEHVSAYEVYVSKDGKSFTKVYEVSGAVENVKQIDTIKLEKGTEARYVKYVQLKRWFASQWNTYYSGGISEFRVFSFDEDEYHALIDEAIEFLKTSDKNDFRRAEVRRLANELEDYLAGNLIFAANAEYMYDQLVAALNGEITPPETSDDPSEDNSDGTSEDNSEGTSEDNSEETSEDNSVENVTSEEDSKVEENNSEEASNGTDTTEPVSEGEENVSDDTSKDASGSDKNGGSSMLWPILGAIAAVAAAAVVAVLVIKKKRKS